MVYSGFTNNYFAGKPIKIFNNGDFEKDLYRDFTYIDDIKNFFVKYIDCRKLCLYKWG